MFNVSAMKKQTTAEAYWLGGEALPEDLDDAWVLRPGGELLSEVWDVGTKKIDGKIALYGSWPGALLVDPATPIYYT